MSVVDFSEIKETIKDKIESYPSSSFRYVPIADWQDEEGEIKSTIADGGFTIFLAEADKDPNAASDNFFLINTELRFAFSAQNDYYLKKIGYALESVRTLRTISNDDNLKIKLLVPSFTNELSGNKVISTYENIIFMINI